MTEQKIIKSREKSKIKIGDKFGRWVVLENIGVRKEKTYFKCLCICGNIKVVLGSHLSSNHSKSCGCLKKEQAIIHGMYRTPEYNAWNAMIQRCTNPNNPAYKNYGGRGITVCTEWKDSFIAFFTDMGKRPERLTLERKNNNLGYSKENCIWDTRINQSRNQRIWQKNRTGMRGIYWCKKRQKYSVNIGVNNKQYYIGIFKDLEEAKAARIAAEQKYWE